jgi:hypothetical protein
VISLIGTHIFLKYLKYVPGTAPNLICTNTRYTGGMGILRGSQWHNPSWSSARKTWHRDSRPREIIVLACCGQRAPAFLVSHSWELICSSCRCSACIGKSNTIVGANTHDISDYQRISMVTHPFYTFNAFYLSDNYLCTVKYLNVRIC